MLCNQGSPFSHEAGIQRTMGNKDLYYFKIPKVQEEMTRKPK